METRGGDGTAGRGESAGQSVAEMIEEKAMDRMTRRWLATTLVFLIWTGTPRAQPPGGRVAHPETVKVLRDINYAGTSNPAQTLDLYLPKAAAGDKPLPVVVNIHGGAFRMGDKGMGVGEVLGLVAGGDYAAVSINY